MPRHDDFEKVYQQFVDRYGEEKGKAVYYAWLNSFDPPLDDTKPMPEKLPPKKKKEAYIMPLNIDNLDGRVYLVKTPHVGTTGSLDLVDEEGLPRLRHYDADELKRAARTLINAPANLNHFNLLPNARVIWADFSDEEEAVNALVLSRNAVLDKTYDEGKIVGASVEFGAIDFPQVDGVKPAGIVFTGLAFVTNDFQPGDPKSRVILLKEILAPSSEKGASSQLESDEVKGMREKQEAKEPEHKEETPAVLEEMDKVAQLKAKIETLGKEGADIVATIAKLKESFAAEEPTPQDIQQRLDGISNWVSDIAGILADLKARVERLEQVLMTRETKKEVLVPTIKDMLAELAKGAPQLTESQRNFWSAMLGYLKAVFSDMADEFDKTSAEIEKAKTEGGGSEGKKETVEEQGGTPPTKTEEKEATTPPSGQEQKQPESTQQAESQGVGIVESKPAAGPTTVDRAERIIARIPRSEQLPPKMGRPFVSRMLEEIKQAIREGLKE